MKFNESINRFYEELIRPDKEYGYQVSDDYKYVWMITMKMDDTIGEEYDGYFLIVVDGPPLEEPKNKESKFKKVVNYTKQTAWNLLNSLRKRFLESSSDNVIDSLKIPFNSTDYGDVKESLLYSKEIIQGSKDLYDIEGIISLKEEDIEKYVTG